MKILNYSKMIVFSCVISYWALYPMENKPTGFYQRANNEKKEVNRNLANIQEHAPIKNNNVETWKQLSKRKCNSCIAYVLPGFLGVLWMYLNCYFSDQCSR